MKKVTVIGHYGEGRKKSDGQTVKTETITKELEKHYGAAKVRRVDTHGGLKTLLKACLIVKTAFRTSANVIILPAQNGLRVFAPLCAVWKKRRPDVRLHYIVIGGWLPQFVKQHRFLIGKLKKFDAIYVETTAMKKALERMDFNNVILMPNCKELNVLREEELVYSKAEPLKLCTFSRVMKEKGIEEAVNTVRDINSQCGREVYRLDIYGQVESGQEVWFDGLKNSFPSCVKYMGVVPFEGSVSVLKDYFSLLFPTRFYTEGIPGTIIDAFAAGVPVISSKWENYNDILEDDVTGIGYDFDDFDGFKNVLLLLAEHPERIIQMKTKCLCKAKEYTPENVLKVLINKMDG